MSSDFEQTKNEFLGMVAKTMLRGVFGVAVLPKGRVYINPATGEIRLSDGQTVFEPKKAGEIAKLLRDAGRKV